MSGHSKWSQIKHKKGITDKKKAQLFSKLSKLISLAAKKGPRPEINIELRNAIEHARTFNMPKDNIDRAIKKAADRSLAELKELSIEAIGPGGIALKIKAITDNSNRTIAEVKKILDDNNSKMVNPGSVSWMFNQPSSPIDTVAHEELDKLFEALDDHDDIEDVVSNLQ